MDIAGPALLESNDHYKSKGGSGYGVRLLVDFLKNIKITESAFLPPTMLFNSFRNTAMNNYIKSSLIIFLLSPLFGLTAQERFANIVELRSKPLFYNELNYTTFTKDSTGFVYSFRISHDYISFFNSTPNSATPQYNTKVTSNLELQFEDGRIERFAKSFEKTETVYNNTKDKFKFLTGSIEGSFNGKLVVYVSLKSWTMETTNHYSLLH